MIGCKINLSFLVLYNIISKNLSNYNINFRGNMIIIFGSKNFGTVGSYYCERCHSTSE